MWTTPARSVIVPWVLLALVGLAVLLWLRFAPSPLPIYQAVPGPTQYVPVPQRIVKVKTVTVPGPKEVVLVPSVIASEKLKWPEIAQDNILAIGAVPPHRGTTSVVAVAEFKDNTMTTRLIMRQEPPKFLELKKELRLGAYLGNGGLFSGEVAVRPLRIGPVDTVGKVQGVWGSGTNEVRAFVGVEVQFGF